MRARDRIALLLALLALGVAGCGGDEEPVAEEVETTAPERKERERADRGDKPAPAETDTTESEPAVTTPAPAPAPSPPSSGGEGGSSPAPGGGGSGRPDPSKPDAPGNDIPPPPGSPAERFEEFCEQNPAACG